MYSHMYIYICVYEYRAIRGESTLVWGFFPGEGRGEPGWTVAPSPFCCLEGGGGVFSSPPPPMLVGLWQVRGGSGMWGDGRELGVLLRSWRGSPAGWGSGGAGLWPCWGKLRGAMGAGRHSLFYPHPLTPSTSFPCNAFLSVICGEGGRGKEES